VSPDALAAVVALAATAAVFAAIAWWVG